MRSGLYIAEVSADRVTETYIPDEVREFERLNRLSARSRQAQEREKAARKSQADAVRRTQAREKARKKRARNQTAKRIAVLTAGIGVLGAAAYFGWASAWFAAAVGAALLGAACWALGKYFGGRRT